MIDTSDFSPVYRIVFHFDVIKFASAIHGNELDLSGSIPYSWADARSLAELMISAVCPFVGCDMSLTLRGYLDIDERKLVRLLHEGKFSLFENGINCWADARWVAASMIAHAKRNMS